MKTKQQLILEEIVLPYHPVFQTNQRFWRSAAGADPGIFNVEHLTETAMAHVGGYRYVDEYRYDFSDYSECKTATINQRACSAMISNIATATRKSTGEFVGGPPKLGDLRVVIHNPYRDRLEYYFLPKAEWDLMRDWGEANYTRLRSAYNIAEDCLTRWQDYRVPDFETLARCPSTVTDPIRWLIDRDPLSHLFVYENDPEYLLLELEDQ